jgi:hypothetical protein
VGDARWLARIIAAGLWKAKGVIALTGAYFALGAYLALHSDVVVLDALSRSAHAYFVWHNGPPKLSGIGFVWPPVATLTLLPFAVFDKFGRTGLVAPLVSAIATASLVWYVAATMRSLEVPRWVSGSVVALMAISPMIVFYGANGMSEVWALLFPSIAVGAMIRWHETRTSTSLAVSSFGSAFAVMSRYDLGLIAALLVAGVVVQVLLDDRDVNKARAIGLFYILPIVYCIGAWMYFNWSVQGSPVWFLTAGGQLGTVSGTEALQGDRVAGIISLLKVHVLLSPMAFVVAFVLLIHAAVQRSWMSFVISGAVLANPVTNFVLLMLSANQGLTQLRYNMRSIPIAIIAGAWLYRELRKDGKLVAAPWGVAMISLSMAAIPGNLNLMGHHPYQFQEQPFLKAITTGKDLSHTQGLRGQAIGCDGARDMGRWIDHHVKGRNSILADVASSYAVMLFSGHPERFIDQIDRSQAYFIDQVGRPSKRVKYILTPEFSFCSGVGYDINSQWYSSLGYDIARQDQLPPGLTMEHRTTGFRLLRIHHRQLREFVRETRIKDRAKQQRAGKPTDIGPGDLPADEDHEPEVDPDLDDS